MNKQILILLIFVPTMLFAQKTQKVTDKTTKETFYVLNLTKKPDTVNTKNMVITN